MVYRDTRWNCPRDGHSLEALRVGTHSFMRCAQCRGAFLEPHVLAAMLVEMGAEHQIAARPLPDLPRPLRCPSCTEPLARSQLAGIEIDACAQHGIWFDRGELEAVLEWAGLAALARR
jgi:Zn-finger nucleic acid-binding protein